MDEFGGFETMPGVDALTERVSHLGPPWYAVRASPKS
jgi:hypothetical protein